MRSRDARSAGEEGLLLVVDAFERRQDVLDVVAGDAVEVKEGGVEFGHEFGPLGFIPLVEPAAVFRLEAAAR